MARPKKMMFVRDHIRMAVLSVAESGVSHPTHKALLIGVCQTKRATLGHNLERHVNDETRMTAAEYIRSLMAEHLITRDRSEHALVLTKEGEVALASLRTIHKDTPTNTHRPIRDLSINL